MLMNCIMNQVEITIVDDCFHISDMDDSNKMKTKTKKWRRGVEYYISVSVTIGIAVGFCIWTYIVVLDMDSIPDH